MKSGKVLVTGTSKEIIDNYKGMVWEVNMPAKEAYEIDTVCDLGNYKVEEGGSVSIKSYIRYKTAPFSTSDRVKTDWHLSGLTEEFKGFNGEYLYNLKRNEYLPLRDGNGVNQND